MKVIPMHYCKHALHADKTGSVLILYTLNTTYPVSPWPWTERRERRRRVETVIMITVDYRGDDCSF